MKLTYTQIGDYAIPDILPPESSSPLSRWGCMYLSHLEKNHPTQYTRLFLSGELFTLLSTVNEQAEYRLQTLIRQMAKAEGVTEALKAEDQMRWVRSMNSIRSRAEEIVIGELLSENR